MHKAKSLLISCIDFRFQSLLEEYMKTQAQSIHVYDHVAIAGGIRSLIHPAIPQERDILLKQVDISYSLHKPDHFYLINHDDCGAYPKGTTATEHKNDLVNAQDMLYKLYPEVIIHIGIAYLDHIEEYKKVANKE